MATVKLGLATMSLDQKLALGLSFETNMAGNPNFPSPDPPLNQINAGRMGLNAQLVQRAQLIAQLETLDEEIEEAEVAFTELLRREGSYIQTASGGDPAIILESGAQVANGRTPPPPTPQVINVIAEGNGFEGVLHVKWKSLGRRYSYELEISLTPNDPNSWEHADVSKKARYDLTGLESGKKTWVRVRAQGPNGPGPWSDPACAMVP